MRRTSLVVAFAILICYLSPRWSIAQFGGGGGGGGFAKGASTDFPEFDDAKEMVKLSLWVVTLSPPAAKEKSEGDGGGKLPERVANLSGNLGKTENVRHLLERLKGAGLVRSCRELQLTALDLQPAHVQIGGNKPQVTATNTSAAGRRTNMISMQSVGISVEAQCRIVAENQIVVRMEYGKSDVERAPDVVLEEATGEKPNLASGVVMQELKTTVRLKSGTAAVLQSDASDGSANNASEGTLKLIILGAEILPSKERGKEPPKE